jgi:inner membrane protein
MSGANHIVGGTVFTGIYLSMWDTNLFSQPLFLFFTAFFAVLPDIDHTKSPIGTVFYPIAKYLDKKFGHRTITHSLVCYILLILFVGSIERIISDNRIITSIFIWSYGSHLILDMVTKQGVPLFYPWKKNPCVIPANPDFRFKSSDFRTETVVFMVFILLGYSCKNLFAQGFWNTYNRKFSNIKHVWNETKLSSNIISVNYDIIKQGQQKKGIGYVIEAKQNSLLIHDTTFISIDNNTTVKELIPTRTNKTLNKSELQFSDIRMDSLRRLINNKMIISLKIQSLLPIYFIKENQPQASTNFSLEYIVNPLLRSDRIDSTDMNVAREISEIELQIKLSNDIENQFQQQQIIATEDLKNTENELSSEDLATKEKAIQQVERKRSAVAQLQKPTHQNFPLLKLRLDFLRKKLRIIKDQKVSGYLAFYTIN